MSNLYKSTLASAGTAPTGDAVAADVLTGKTFSNASATGISGTMVNNGAVSGTATPSQPYTIPEGYHNGNGKVTATGTTPASVTSNVVSSASPYDVSISAPVGTRVVFQIYSGNPSYTFSTVSISGATKTTTLIDGASSARMAYIIDMTASTAHITGNRGGSSALQVEYAYSI